MTPAELNAAGERLYGAQWRAALGRALDVSDRTVRRWAAGEWPIPRPAALAIEALVENSKRRNRREPR